MPAKRNRKKKDQTMEKGSYYTYGNVAYDLEPVYSPLAEQKEQERERKRKQRNRARIAKAAAVERLRVSAKSFAAAFLLFFGCIIFMGTNVIVHNAEVSLRRQKSELEDLKSVNAILETELIEQLDMDYIRQEAKERLGMSEPQSYQVVYIDVPKQSYTVQHAADDTAQERSWTQKIADLFKKD